jgi:hypothetical protein
VLLAESKNGHSRTIPLTPKALEVLASVRRQACSSRYESTEPLCEVAHEASNWGDPEGTQKGISNGRWGWSCTEGAEGVEVIEDTGGNPSAISNGEGAPGDDGDEPRCSHPSKPKVFQEPNLSGIQKGISNGGIATLSNPSHCHSVRFEISLKDSSPPSPYRDPPANVYSTLCAARMITPLPRVPRARPRKA